MRNCALVLIGVVLGSLVPSFAQSDRVVGVNHVGIVVEHFDEALAFYTQKMGFREAFTVRDDKGQPVLAYVQVSRNTFVELQPVTADRRPGINHVGLEVDNIQATIDRLKQHGVVVEDARVSRTNSKIANATDPNGVRIELSELPPGSLQRKAIEAWK
jgi:catechol 2,3-dioxygenase-like lactoylglutathione lyase family enzyme